MKFFGARPVLLRNKCGTAIVLHDLLYYKDVKSKNDEKSEDCEWKGESVICNQFIYYSLQFVESY